MKEDKQKKKVVATNAPKAAPAKAKVNRPEATKQKQRSDKHTMSLNVLFGPKNYLWMGIGLGLIVLGMLLMLGGGMPDANTWKPEVIYSPVRITLAPILILAGLALQVVAIFKK